MGKIHSIEDYRLFGYFFKFLTSSISFIDRATVAYETYHAVDPECRLALVMYLLQHGRNQVSAEWPTKERKIWSHQDYLLWVSENHENVLSFLQSLQDRQLPLEETAVELWRMIESFSSNQESYFALGFCLLQPDFMPYEHDRPDGKFLPGARSFAKIQLGTTEGYTTADDQEHVAGSLMFLTSGLQRVLSDTPGIPEGLKVSNEDNRFLIIRNCDGDQVLSCHPQTAYVLHSFVELVSEMDVTESRIMARRFGVSSEILDSILPDSMEVFARNLREDIDISFTAHVILKRELKWGVYDTLGRQFVDSVLNNRQLEETVAES